MGQNRFKLLHKIKYLNKYIRLDQFTHQLYLSICALVISLISTPSFLRRAALRIRVYVSGRPLVSVLQLLNVHISV